MGKIGTSLTARGRRWLAAPVLVLLLRQPCPAAAPPAGPDVPTSAEFRRALIVLAMTTKEPLVSGRRLPLLLSTPVRKGEDTFEIDIFQCQLRLKVFTATIQQKLVTYGYNFSEGATKVEAERTTQFSGTLRRLPGGRRWEASITTRFSWSTTKSSP